MGAGRARRVSGVVVALAALVACGGPGPRPPHGNVTPPNAGVVGSAPNHARWFLHGYDDFRATSYVRTEDGELFFGANGERLLRTGTVLRAAEDLLPETIVSAQLQSGKLRLLGASGTLYLGTSALGPFTAKLSPFDGARAASASESALFVLDRASKLHRSVDGVAWSDVTLPGLAGVVTSIAMAGKHGVVTAVPPQLFVTHDDGATFALAPAPPAGVSRVVVDRESVLARTASGWARFDPAAPTASGGFVTAMGPGLWSPQWPARPGVVQALAGAIEVDLARGATPELAVHALDAPATYQALELPSPCTQLTPATDATSVAVRCDGPADAPGTTLVYVRAANGAFAPLAKLDPGGTTHTDHAALALGPDGAVFVGERCKDEWSTECARPVARVAKDGPFVPIPQGVALAAAWEPAHAGFLVVATDRERTRLLRIGARSAGAAPTVEDLGVLFPGEAQTATLGIGADGSAGIVVRAGEEVAAFVTSGSTFKAAAVPALRLHGGALAGANGLVLTESGRAFETNDGASTWHEVLAPAASHGVLGCSTAGCLTDRGARVGWDGASGGSPFFARAARTGTTPKGLRCKAAGPRMPTGSFPSVPRASALDHGPYRIVLASRDGDGGIRALRSAWADAPSRFASADVLGPGQPYPAFGTRAVLLTQTGGVVAARYTWKRIRFAGTFNPIALEVGWLRDGEPAPHRAATTLAPYRSDTAFLDRASESATLPEVLALAPDGVHWRAPETTGDLAIGRFFMDRGGEKKVPFALDLAGKHAFVSGDRDAPTLAADHDGDLGIAEVTEKRSTVVLPGVDDAERALVFATLGGKPLAIATDRRAGRSFAFPVALRPGGAPAFELPTQRSLDGVASCAPTTPGDPLDLPWTVGTRRAIRVVDAGTERLFVTDRARVRVSGSAVTCVTGWDAVPLDHPTASLLVLDGGTRALLVEMAPAANAGGAVLPLACAPDDGAPSLAYGDVEGM